MTSQSLVENSLEPWLQLKNKIVMVTGASSGLGREFCLDLAKAGCKIIAAARRIDRLKSLCDQINSEPIQDQPRAVAVELDISASEPIIKARVQEAWQVFGRIDALVNNAGVRERVHGPLDLSEEEWSSVVKTNQTGTWVVTKCVCKHMRDAKLQGYGGSVINISSISGLNRVQFHGGHAYSASKAAINSFTMVTALELGKFKIRVNSISPALFESQITQGLLQKDWLRKVMARATPLRNEGTIVPGLTSLVRYLVHDSSHYVTGNVFIVDGGLTLPGIPIFSSL